ncbi:hypothetical protein [Nitrososphaeria virus YSH_462411]|uniref:Uncharacterized protein n=1 Tax=Nitrososphaeria virus YSH_462411 TaxID=3071321 RepID=A0A976UB53_9CAUD|nr:hypothetical protein QKV92_gp30 [Yangshan Harbor Nitrososphaeria virus]UVF62302.1 hypothetical protein [Nitrososphaeria virus YSH_462411]
MVFGKKDNQPNGKNSPNENTKRRDTGRTDKYSDQTPRKDWEEYRKDNPKDEYRKDMKEDGDIDKQKKSIEFIKQEITATIQEYMETFNSAELNEWENKLQRQIHELQKFK